MAIGNMLRDSIVAVEEESTEGTYVAPSGTGVYIQVEPDISITPSKELNEREFINASVGLSKPLLGMKSVEASLSFEARSGGNGGTASDYDYLFKNVLGTRTATSDATTTGSSSTTTTIDLVSASGIVAGDMVYTKKGSGASSVRWVTGVASNTLTVAPAMAAGEVPGAGVTVSGTVNYKPKDTVGNYLSLSTYWANTVREAVVGGQITNLSLANWEVGKVARWSCTMQGLTYTRIDGAAPHTPAYISQVPPVLLSASIFQDATEIKIKSFSLSIDNEIAKLTNIGDSNGAFQQILTKRTVTGSFAPYMDDTSVANFTAFNADTAFSIMLVAGTVDSNGDFNEGSITGIYLPQCIFTANSITNEDGVLMESLEFRAHRGTEGTSDEVYIGHG